jgi:hypothetical protein
MTTRVKTTTTENLKNFLNDIIKNSATEMDIMHESLQSVNIDQNNMYSCPMDSKIEQYSEKIVSAIKSPKSAIGLATLLGLFAFSLPNMMNAMWECSLLVYPSGAKMETAVANEGMMAIVPIAFVGQFLAGLWNLSKGDTFGSMTQSAYGLFWLLY